mgnify:CR=1 FL=1
MNNIRMNYFQEGDIVHLAISEDFESSSVEVSPNITAELNERGELIGIEILEASTYLRDAILESAQGKILALQTVEKT